MKKKSQGPHREHPLILTGHSVLAIIANMKTMTRRLILRPKVGKRVIGCDACWNASVPHNGEDAAFGGPCYLRVPACDHVGGDGYPGGGRIWPKWNVGDHVWVKEGWATRHAFDPYKPSELKQGTRIHYRATWEGPSGLMWRTSMYMPRWASRVTLELVTVRVERLHEISDDDVVAEGLDMVNRDRSKVVAFADLWDQINGKRAPWSSNPFVFAISFKRICQCESAVEEPGPHLKTCRFADPTHDVCPF